MKNIWTNETYANWLKDRDIKELEYSLVELKWDDGYHIPNKVIGKGKTEKDIVLPKPNNKKWYVYLRYKKLESGIYFIGSSMDFQVR